MVNLISLVGVWMGLNSHSLSPTVKQYALVFVAGNFMYIASDIWKNLFHNKKNVVNLLELIGLLLGVYLTLGHTHWWCISIVIYIWLQMWSAKFILSKLTNIFNLVKWTGNWSSLGYLNYSILVILLIINGMLLFPLSCRRRSILRWNPRQKVEKNQSQPRSTSY